MSSSNNNITNAPSLHSGDATAEYAPPKMPTTFAPRKFAVEHPVVSESGYDRMMNGLGNCLGSFGQLPFCCCCTNPYRNVPQGFVGLVSRFGRYYKTADPGLVSVNTKTETIKFVDTKIQIQPIEQLPIVTKDNVSVGIEAVLYWHITDPYLATYGVSNVRQALTERTQTTLRTVLGGRDLQGLIENRNTIASGITEIIDKPAREWGVTVESILIKDVTLSKQLQDSLSSAATQHRIAEAKVIQAQAEVDAAKLMREASEILNTPAAMQIRTLDSLVMMAKSANAKVLFVPVNQDYSNGSINAFGGAGSTLGINTTMPPQQGQQQPMLHPHSFPTTMPIPHQYENSQLISDNQDNQPTTTSATNNSSGMPISQAVKDAVIYSQLTEM
ncbi:hypothetical protein IW140_002131 [Coemansia sp. RSA 1813]|nr:hypothetical protein EV178_001280 [Coemansia sp. RSA 1646]KAJ1772631.1 hypothetical protein LPJ74_001347 [Coemansia sp. RSA 1843]KAJ2090228.1 hypothetical protein IW138_002860 [Coemansia sp. RSA 986]KAJ2214633.1 hypothetical protein EV179_002892 [Coemansia sp. RSA 487]KAJ2570705.1 hypothetical protein IW140_002131 [Coemansia sp. RSA 1813]